MPEIIAAAPALQGQARLVRGHRNWAARINGTTADYFFVRGWAIAAGRGLSRREEAGAGKVALIGATVADRHFGEADPVGAEIRVLNTPVRVIGVLARKGESGSCRDQDDIVFVPLTTARPRLGAAEPGVRPGAVSYCLAKAAADDVVDAARTGIEGLLRRRAPSASRSSRRR